MNSGNEPWTIDLKIGSVCIRFKFDCGADVTVISENMYLKLGKLFFEKNVLKGCMVRVLYH